MANNETDDRELNNYLNGNSELSNRYRASNKQETPSYLDDAILSAAKEAVNVSNKIKQKTKPGFHKAPWVKPLSIAAMITLSVSLVVTMQQEAGQPLINESDIEMFDSASMIKESAISETRLSSDDASAMRVIESGKNKDERVAVPASASAASGSAVNRYRAEEKTEAPKARLKAIPAKKMQLKEKPLLEAAEDRAVAEEEGLRSTPSGAMFDDVVALKQDREISMQEKALIKIKVLWEKGELVKARQAYEDFTRDYPGVATASIKESLGISIYNGLLED